MQIDVVIGMLDSTGSQVVSYQYNSWGKPLTATDTTDVLTAIPMGLTDKKRYAYCDNNPAVRVDRNGQFWDYVVDIGFLAWSVADVANAINKVDFRPVENS